MGFGGIRVGSSIRVMLVEPGWLGMILSTGAGAIIVIIIITVGGAILIVIIVTIVPVSIVIIVVVTILAHVVVVVGRGTVECIPVTIIVGFTTVVVVTITAIIISLIPAMLVTIIMSNTFLCCTILGVGDCCTIEPLTSSMCLYGSTRWGDSASVVFKGARCGMAVHGDGVVIVGINVDITLTTIITIVVVIIIRSLEIAGRIVIVIVIGRILDDALIT